MIKNLILILLFLSIFSCKKDSILNQEIKEDNIIQIFSEENIERLSKSEQLEITALCMYFITFNSHDKDFFYNKTLKKLIIENKEKIDLYMDILKQGEKDFKYVNIFKNP